MDVNILQLLGLEELFEENDKLLEVEDILDSVTLPTVNPWGVPLPPIGESLVPASRQKQKNIRGALALALNILIYLVCAAVIAVSLILKFSGYNDSILGYHIYHVESGSMTPSADGSSPPGGFRENDAIIVKNTAPENVKQGDVINFWQNDERRGKTITHRVVEVLNNGGTDIQFKTKGDHNEGPDADPVPGGRLIGVKVFTLPRLGGALRTAQAHPYITAGVSFGVMAAVFIIYVVTTRRAGKKRR